MHLNLRLPEVESLHSEPPTRSPPRDPKDPTKNYHGTHFKEHPPQHRRLIRDTRHTQVTARRYRRAVYVRYEKRSIFRIS
jgi:hypothetical protein